MSRTAAHLMRMLALVRASAVLAIGALTAHAQAAELTMSGAAAVAPNCARDGRRLQRQPACAMGKSVYLVVWSDGTRQLEQPTADIYCARIDGRTGKVLDREGIRVCAAKDLQEWPAVAFDGNSFLIVWQDLRNGRDYDLYAARVSEEGKVLDPDGFAVASRAANQARPSVAFAGSHFVVVWMDARQYPVTGIFAARVAPQGKVLDAEGVALSVEDTAQVAKVTPPQPQWLGDRHYWWKGLQSRFHPTIVWDGKACLVTFLREMHANQTKGQALLMDPADLSIKSKLVPLSGEPRDRIAACATPDGWVATFDQWMAGWSPSPRLAALNLSADLSPRNIVVDRPDQKPAAPAVPAAPLLDVQKSLAPDAGSYQQGKGHFAFWQTTAAWNGRHVIVAMDYAWRQKQKADRLHYAIVVTRLDSRGERFLDDPPVLLAAGSSEQGTAVANPSAAAGGDGNVLVVYESDAGIDRQTIHYRVVRSD